MLPKCVISHPTEQVLRQKLARKAKKRALGGCVVWGVALDGCLGVGWLCCLGFGVCAAVLLFVFGASVVNSLMGLLSGAPTYSNTTTNLELTRVARSC